MKTKIKPPTHHLLESAEEIRDLLKMARTIAVVGASAKPWRDSNQIAAYLQDKGYAVYPVNPVYESVRGVKCYPDLRSVPDAIDIVDIFRRVEAVPAIVQEAIEVGAKAVWMQSGIVHHQAAELALQAGLLVVMDRCIAVEHRSLLR
jgi:predicted CoA-binding protein